MNKERKIISDCPCTQVSYKKHEDYIACIAEHRKHRKHLPECMQDYY